MRKYTDSEAVNMITEAGFKPLEKYPGAKKDWRCIHIVCGNQVEVTLSYVAKSKRKTCKFCQQFAPITPERAEQIMLEAGFRPLNDYPGYDTPWKSAHLACGATINPRLHSVKAGKGSCVKCGRTTSATKRTTPSETAIEEMRAAGLEPLELFKGVRVSWKCHCLSCGKTVSPQLGSIRAGRGGCKYCAGNVLLTKDKAIAIMLKNNLQPLEEYVNALTAWRAKCLKCGQIVSPKLGAISGGQGPCVYCAGKKVDLEYAIEIMLSANLKPLEPFKTVRRPWKSLCLVCENVVTPRLASVIKNGRACSFCSETGFNTGETGYIYFLIHPQWVMFQIGITNKPADRLKQHNRLGWETKELRGPMDGLVTQKWERSILVMLKAMGADLKNSQIAGKFDGYSEAWSQSTFQVDSIKELMRLTEEFEASK